MVRRFVALLLAGALALCGLVSADDAPPAEKEKGEGPLRLKRKKRPDAPAPAKEKDKDKGPEKEDDLKKKPVKDGDRLKPEDGPPPAEEVDDKELMERIAKNMRAVEEKLSNREVGEPTRQQQRDILDDIDRLLKKSEQQDQNQGQNQDQDQQPQGGGGGGGGQQKQQQQQKQSAGRQQKGGGKQGGKQGRQRPRRQLRNERGEGGQRQGGKPDGKQGKEMDQPGPEPKGGETPGGGGTGQANERDLTADLYKNIWGHLPESLRAEMNAYSNPSPFLPRYDRVISEYYKTIARQGRKKGD